MGCLVCCCFTKAPETLERRNSSLSDLETIRPQILKFELPAETEIPFLDMNPLLVEKDSKRTEFE